MKDDLAQRFISLLTAAMEENGYFPSVRSDMDVWADLFVRSGLPINPTFVRASQGPCYWIDVQKEGQTVACIANRLFVTDDYLRLMRTGEMWGVTFDEPQVLVTPPEAPFISGNVGHHGGVARFPGCEQGWVAWALPRLARAMSVNNWDAGFHAGNLFPAMLKSGIQHRGYGYAALYPNIESDYFPPMQGPATLYLTLISRAEMNEQLAADVSFLETCATADFIPAVQLKQMG